MAKHSNSKIPNIDGVLPRSPRGPIGDFKNPRKLSVSQLSSSGVRNERPANVVTSDKEVESVIFDDDTKPPKPSRKQNRKEKKQEKKRKKAEKRSRKMKFIPKFLLRSPIKSLLMFVGLALLLVSGLLGVRLYLAQADVFDRNSGGALALRANIDPSELTGEGDGRVNVMIAGIGGAGHDGGNLADTIIIVSIDPFAKEVAMLSVPRDMYVAVPGHWSTSINAAHAIGEDGGFREVGYPDGGIGLLKKTLEETLDISIHYYVRVDFAAFKDVVDAVGGIVLDVKTPVYDRTFAWEWRVLDVATGKQYFDGERALFYARSRLTSVGGDFARSDRQRDIIVALKDKVLSVGTFANPLRISSLIDAVGGGVRTNLSKSEILRLYEIAGDVTSDRIVSVGLNNGTDGLLVDQTIGARAVLVPRAGDFGEIQKFVRSIFVDGFIKKENATIEVFNGTATEGRATEYAAMLGTFGYNVVNIGSMTDRSYTTPRLYDLSEGNPFTRRYLEQRVGVLASPNSELPQELRNSTSNFIIILGTDGQGN